MLVRLVAIFVVGLLVASSGATSAGAGDQVGVILMHGKGGSAMGKSPIGKLKNAIGGDYNVVAPDMPWSRSRQIDKTLEQTFTEIDDIIAKLRADGATKIVLGGHSMGAAVALAYGASHSGLNGILAMAPGHRPDAKTAQPNRPIIEKAKQLVAQGKADETVLVSDFNQGESFTRTLRADIAIGWFDPDGPIVMQNAAAKIPPEVPVLFIIGEKDGLHPKGKMLIFDKLPANPKSAYVVVPGGHGATPIKGKKEIAAWLNGL